MTVADGGELLDRHHADRQHRQWRNCDRGHQRATGRALGLYDSNTTLVLGRVSGTFVSGEALQVTAVTHHRHQCRHAQRRHAAQRPRRLQGFWRPTTAGPTSPRLLDPVHRAAGSSSTMSSTCSGTTPGNCGQPVEVVGWWLGAGDVRTRTAVHRRRGEITASQTVTGLTSGATAVVVRAMLRTGTWTVSGCRDADFASVTGTFQNGENVQVGGVTKVVANGADTAITRAPGGRVETVTANYTGSASTWRGVRLRRREPGL